MQNELITIIIPVKNGSNYLSEAINGIKNQNMNVEIIVVDDASTDNTSEIAESLGCKVIKHSECKGPVVAKNTALKSANGKYIMFHDHDDIMVKGALPKLYDELCKSEDSKIVMAKVKDFGTDNMKDKIKPEAYYGLFTGAVLIKKEVFDVIGLFDESLTAGEIISFQTKLNEQNIEIKKIDILATNRRIHDTNFGRTNQKKEYKDYASILRSKLRK